MRVGCAVCACCTGGTGLGLSIVKQLVDLQKGAVEVRSEPGVGTSLIMRIPFERATAEEVRLQEVRCSRSRLRCASTC